MTEIFRSREEAEAYYRKHVGNTQMIKIRTKPMGCWKETEHELQVRCIQWFDSNYPNIILFAIPNGGHRHKATAGKLKAEGVRAGIPDLMLASVSSETKEISKNYYKVTTYHGLFIEMKVKPNRPTKAQAEMLQQLTAAGYMTRVIYSFEQFQDCINSYIQNNQNTSK